MKKNIIKYKNSPIILFLLFVAILNSCGIEYTTEQQKYITSIVKMRKVKDNYMKNNPGSPFNVDSNAVFQPLNYYPVSPNFVFNSKLYRYEKQDTVDVYGTKGEVRKTLKFGYIKFDFENKEYKMNVYQGQIKSGEKYYSIWFIDNTTGKETYGVGRYLDFEFNADYNFIYTIDFNLAYNPYCSYSAKYSCAVPTKDDYINIALTVGEKNFH
ncbi:MAG: DUF1684 domain-containing protein [Bacteroidetes bacterium]|nr:DUF1684 domain-containing protein [Bacteroidota bacterium]